MECLRQDSCFLLSRNTPRLFWCRNRSHIPQRQGERPDPAITLIEHRQIIRHTVKDRSPSPRIRTCPIAHERNVNSLLSPRRRDRNQEPPSSLQGREQGSFDAWPFSLSVAKSLLARAHARAFAKLRTDQIDQKLEVQGLPADGMDAAVSCQRRLGRLVLAAQCQSTRVTDNRKVPRAHPMSHHAYCSRNRRSRNQ